MVGRIGDVEYTDDPVVVRSDCLLTADWPLSNAAHFNRSEVVVRSGALHLFDASGMCSQCRFP
jgi:hypothetical protein